LQLSLDTDISIYGKASLRGKIDESKLLIPTLHFRYFERALVEELVDYFDEKFGISRKDIKAAI
jgi:hypothetical protein